MPRKAKENENGELTDTKKKTTSLKTKKAKTSKSVATTTTSKKSTTTKNTKTKTSASTKKKTNTPPTNTTTVKSTTSKKKTTASEKKVATKKPKTTKTSSTKKKSGNQNTTPEYYDLPQKYNQTVVKILAQTPKTIFIYWEISDDDIKKYKKQYGENFFENTKPVLIIHNTTLNYSFEVEINDFANSWYLHINDSKSDYKIELGRRPIKKDNNINTDYIYISSSNAIETPNDHILFNTSNQAVQFRNIKTNQETQKSFSNLSFMKNMGKIYNIYDLYTELYKNEDNLESLSNPSS